MATLRKLFVENADWFGVLSLILGFVAPSLIALWASEQSTLILLASLASCGTGIWLAIAVIKVAPDERATVVASLVLNGMSAFLGLMLLALPLMVEGADPI